MSHPPIKHIDVRDLYEISCCRAVELIDVRTPEEFREVRAVGARNVPLDALDPHRIIVDRQGDAAEPIYFICHLGGRSSHACALLMASGHTNVLNVAGGTDAWLEAGLPVERNT